ncbi:hypothetical protein B0H19DRAFT_1346834 [Mycena capillaripes]|nr:hypothetical protein B0H19DRAFT_1346834 [Mycena capillaripes]
MPDRMQAVGSPAISILYSGLATPGSSARQQLYPWSSAHMLRLQFNCRAARTMFPDDALPHLPVLGYLEFRIELCDYADPWFVGTILTILIPNAAPALAEISVTFPVRECDPPPDISSNLLHAFDTALVAHPAAPSITWRLDVADEDHYRDLTYFFASIRREMPRVEANGRLFFVQFVSQSLCHDGLPSTKKSYICVRIISLRVVSKVRIQLCNEGIDVLGRNDSQLISRLRKLVPLVGLNLQPQSRRNFRTAGESGAEQPGVWGQKFQFRI